KALSAPSAVVPDLISNKVAPKVTGVAAVGLGLSVEPGEWEDLARSPISFSEQWLRCPSTVTTVTQAAECDTIAGAIGQSYTPGKADVGKRVMVRITANVSAPLALSAALPTAPTEVVVGPPDTRIARHPRRTSHLRIAHFTFSSDQPGAEFQ